MGEYMKRSKYISRDAAISKIRDQGVLGGDYDAYEREEDVVDMLNSIPAADVVEVVRGKWLPSDIPDSILDKCSECGFDTGAFTFHYCPNCGAKMDGGQDDGV